jgi:hypothetical protein
MQQHTTRQAGFAHLGLFFLVLVVIVAAVGAGVFVVSKNKEKNGGPGIAEWKKGCSSDERISMTHSPMNMDDVATVAPLGLTAGAHVTPIDHLYFYPKDGPRDKYPVYAMADGYIQEISVRGVNVSSGESRPPEYRIVMQHSCQTISYFDLVTKLDQSILDKYPKAATEGMSGHFAIKAGQEIGRIGAQSLDTAMYNLDMTLPGFIHPDMYKAEPWKVHTDDFFAYFNEPLKSTMLAKNTRMAEPRSGKIDYDKPGKLIGNWFREGTNGYAGPKEAGGIGKDGRGYWSGHLALLYYANDPSQTVVSLGEFKDGQPDAFFVTGNTPDPATVGVDSGVVKYELVQLSPGGGDTGNTKPVSGLPIKGTILFQVLAGEKLKVESFPGKSASQVSDFTSAAQTYER